MTNAWTSDEVDGESRPPTARSPQQASARGRVPRHEREYREVREEPEQRDREPGELGVRRLLHRLAPAAAGADQCGRPVVDVRQVPGHSRAGGSDRGHTDPQHSVAHDGDGSAGERVVQDLRGTRAISNELGRTSYGSPFPT